MAAETFLFDGRTVYFRLPQACTEATPAVFLLTGGDPSELMEQAAASLKKLSPNTEPLFICMPPDRWNLEFSPWPAPALNETDDPFEGGADDYLHFLETRLLPEIRRRFHAGKPFSPAVFSRDIHWAGSPRCMVCFTAAGLTDTAVFPVRCGIPAGWILPRLTRL